MKIKLPTLKKFGWKKNKNKKKRRQALKRIKETVGEDSALFNLSSGLMLSKEKGDNNSYKKFKEDLSWFVNNEKKKEDDRYF